jgi:hypothetical protein
VIPQTRTAGTPTVAPKQIGGDPVTVFLKRKPKRSIARQGILKSRGRRQLDTQLASVASRRAAISAASHSPWPSNPRAEFGLHPRCE